MKIKRFRLLLGEEANSECLAISLAEIISLRIWRRSNLWTCLRNAAKSYGLNRVNGESSLDSMRPDSVTCQCVMQSQNELKKMILNAKIIFLNSLMF